jgi:hypothetical protein
VNESYTTIVVEDYVMLYVYTRGRTLFCTPCSFVLDNWAKFEASCIILPEWIVFCAQTFLGI